MLVDILIINRIILIFFFVTSMFLNFFWELYINAFTFYFACLITNTWFCFFFITIVLGFWRVWGASRESLQHHKLIGEISIEHQREGSVLHYPFNHFPPLQENYDSFDHTFLFSATRDFGLLEVFRFGEGCHLHWQLVLGYDTIHLKPS